MSETRSDESHISRFDIRRKNELANFITQANAYAVTLGGEPTWRHPEIALASLEAEIDLGHCYYILRNDTIAAMICISDSGKDMWPDEEDTDALYFSKLIKNPTVGSRENVRQLLSFTAQKAVDNDYSYIRCDVNESMRGLRDYYERLGFSFKGVAAYTNVDRLGALYEIPALDLLHTVSS